MFTNDNTFIQSKLDGITGQTIHNIMVLPPNGLKVCHSSFYNFDEAMKLKEKLINSTNSATQ